MAQYVPKMYGLWKTECTFLCLKDNLQTLNAISPISELYAAVKDIICIDSLFRMGYKSRAL